MTALHELTALEQRASLRCGEFSATELAEHYLQRIERHDRDLGAFVHVTAELAREEAERADVALREGDERPLLGLPIGFKDLHLIAGVPVTMGTATLDPVISPVDAWTVGLLRGAGTTTLGTTHAPEFGAPCFTHSDVVGRPAVTPYDVTRTAGGSSGGAAAAVAAGLLPFAHGSDGAGSIRIPAAACGLVGFKPTRGRVSSAPTASFLSWTTDGPLARTVTDVALLLDVMANPPAAELHRLLPREGRSFLAAAQDPSVRQLRIASWLDSGRGEPHPAAVAAVTTTTSLLREHGHTVVEIANPAPWIDVTVQSFLTVFGGLASNFVLGSVAVERREQLQGFSRWLLARGERTTAGDFVAATDALAAHAAGFLDAIEPYDLVLTPVTDGPSVPVGHFHEQGSDELANRMLDWAGHNQVQNLAGVPAISLPVHVTAEGLPVAAQLTAARHGDDALLLSVAAQLEELVGWQHRHPAQWQS